MPRAPAALRRLAALLAVAGAPAASGPLGLAVGPLLAKVLSSEPVSGSGDDWLKHWLASLNISVPPVTVEEAGTNITISHIYCNGLQVGAIKSSQTGAGEVMIQATGLQAACQLEWSAYSSSGSATAQIADTEIGSPIRISSTGFGALALPTKIEAYGCAANTRFGKIVIGGAGKVLDALLNNLVVPLFRSTLEALACHELDDAVNSQGSQALQNVSAWVRSFMATEPTSHTPVLPEPREDFLNIAANPAMKLVEQLTVQVLGNSSSPHSLNAVVSKLLGHEGRLSLGTLVALPVSGSFGIPRLGRVNVTLEAMEMSGLNNWSSFLVRTPAAHNVSLDMGLRSLDINVSMKLSVTPDPHGLINGTVLNEPFSLTLSFGDMGASGAAFLAINQTHLRPLTFDQIPQAGCFAPSVFAAMLGQTGLNVVPTVLSLQPTPNMGSLEKDVDGMLNVVVAMLLGLFNETLAAVGDHFVAVNATDILNQRVSDQIGLASLSSCPAPVNIYTDEALSSFAGMAANVLLITGSLGLAGGALMTARRHKRRRARSTREMCRQLSGAEVSVSLAEALGEPNPRPTYPASFPDAAGALAPVTESPAPSQLSLNLPGRPPWDCLALHPSVSKFMRVCLPLLIVGDVLLFVESNTSAGTSVNMSVTANGEEIAQLPYLKAFTLVGSVRDMWEGKVYPLALLIAFFSGFWPYAKLLMMLGCWLMPTRRLSVQRRQTVLELLDALGKWSLVDAFVMVLFMVAFEFDLSVANQAPQVVRDVFDEFGGSTRLLVYVQPLWSFHCFLIATLGSMVLGHIMSMVHRRAHNIAEFGIRADGPVGRTRLCDVKRPPGLHAGRAFAYGPIGALAGSLLLVLVGLGVHTFQFTFLGLSGLALGKEGSVRPFSVVSLAAEVPSANVEPGTYQLLWIQFIFCVFSMAMVVLYHVTLMVLWGAPLSNRVQRHGLVAAQVMNAWNGLDVFVVSIMAGVLEIRQFALFIIGDKCNALDALVERMPAVASRVPGKVTCFDVESELREGFFILLLAVIVSSVTGHVVLARCASALGVEHAEDSASCGTPCTPPATAPASGPPATPRDGGVEEGAALG